VHRPAAPQRAVVEFQSPHHPRTEVFDEDVRSGDKPAYGIDGFGGLQIEHQAFLADVELAEHGAATVPDRRPGSHRLAFDRLDLDHLRAHVGEHPRAMGAGNRGRKIEHAKALEALCQNPLIAGRYGHCKTPCVTYLGDA
jgi:hypothetical protein